MSWSDLNSKLGMCQATLSKYLRVLQDKGILVYYNKEYSLQDLMLEIWLNHQKRNGVYPI